MFCVPLVVLVITSIANGKEVRIFRGELDEFTTIAHCNKSNAFCSDTTCSLCRCKKDQTYIPTRGSYGECVSNNLAVYASSYEESFRMQKNFEFLSSQKCIKSSPDAELETTFVNTKYSCNDHSESDRWIWTNFEQILNWKTLECMTDDYLSSGGDNFVTIKKCDPNDGLQRWICVGDTKYNIIQTQSGRYLNYGDFGNYVTTNKGDSKKWTRRDTTGKQKDVCAKAVGCETYGDGSSILVLNNRKQSKTLGCMGEKIIVLRKTRCNLLPHETQYLHNETWKALEVKNSSFNIKAEGALLKLGWNLRETPKSWEGLLVKAQFKCESNNFETHHCVVIKYAGTFKGFDSDEDDSMGDDDCDKECKEKNCDDDEGESDNDDDESDGEDGKSDNNGSGVDKDGNKTNKDKTEGANVSDSGGEDCTQTIIIIICVVMVLLLIAIALFIMYRLRNRFVCLSKKKVKEQDVPTKEHVVTMNPLYPQSNNLSEGRECELYEPASDQVYQSVDDHKTKDFNDPQNVTYDYAVADGPMTDDKESSEERDTQKRLAHKYHVLEQP